ncbi:hypothetical protein [Flexivirga alba]|uniref:YfhO family protein n=1 Tax=Flexivirga alba TaxID=702742 RepID=A0ABW2AKD6_9MICO
MVEGFGQAGRIGRRGVGAMVGLVCGLIALGPSLAPGYLLHYDLVFVPRLALSDRTLGVDGSVPRAVPNDFVVALLSHIVPGWVVEKALLLAFFVLVGAGVGALMRSRLGAAAAALVAAWNPYVAERLAIGHWGYLLGYACVPLLVAAAAAVREGAPCGRTRLGLWLLLSAATGSTGAVLGLIAVLAVLAMPAGSQASARRRVGEFGWVLVIFVLANATWWYAYLFLAPSQSTSRVGVEAFMTRADTPWGVLGSLLTGGGIWNQGVWFSERQSLVVSGLALLVVVVSVALALRDRVWRAGPVLSGLTLAGVVGLVLAAASAVPGGSQLMTAVVTDLPGGGLLRDAQKFVGLWVLLVAVLAGRLVERVRSAGAAAGAQRTAALSIAAVVACWPVVTLTGLAWGAGGQWRSVDYPSSYTRMAQRIDALPAGGVAVFPWALYRQYSFDHNVVVLDPWQRLLDRDVLVNDDLPLVGGTVVPGESPDAHRVTAAVQSGVGIVSALRDGGVRYVLMQTDQPAAGDIHEVTGRSPIASAGDLRLYDLGATGVRAPTDSGAGRYTGWVLAGLAVIVVAGNFVLDRKRGIAHGR